MGSSEHGSQETGQWGGCLVLSSCCFWPRSSAGEWGGGYPGARDVNEPCWDHRGQE